MEQIIKDCVVCKNVQPRPLRGPGPPDLPIYHLSNDYAFSYTDIDITSPL